MNYETDKLSSIYLRPGEMHLSAEPTQVTTVLGSCVSVTMFSPRLEVGAICHVMLPKCKCRENCKDGCIYYFNGGCQRECKNSFKYADCSIGRMIKDFLEYGAGKNELEIKLFGGSDMFSSRGNNGNSINVGKQNIAVALQMIEEAGLRLVTYDVGGGCGRKIIFYTHTGEIFLKRLQGSACAPGMVQSG